MMRPETMRLGLADYSYLFFRTVEDCCGDRAGTQSLCESPGPPRVCTVALGAYISALVLPLQ